jgi:hypothetical protein
MVGDWSVKFEQAVENIYKPKACMRNMTLKGRQQNGNGKMNTYDLLSVSAHDATGNNFIMLYERTTVSSIRYI